MKRQVAIIGTGWVGSSVAISTLQLGAIAIIQDIGRRLAGCRRIIVLVTNPVDILTKVMAAVSGLPLAAY